MAANEHAQLLDNLDMLVVDERKIVSFKWLSRSFSLPSNTAKEVLETYSQQKKDAVKTVHLVSGWTRTEPRTFSIHLVAESKLESTLANLEEAASHVYSVQLSLPKDPAALWTPDFIQAEELFNQPPDQDNCLRNNSLSAVAFPHVNRTPGGGRKAAVVPPANTEPALKAVTAKITAERPAATPPASPVIKKDEAEEAAPKAAKPGATPKVGGRAAKPKAAPAKGGLANLWGKAPPVKPKAAAVKAEAGKGADARAGDAEARIRAMEEAQEASSGEEEEELAPRGKGGRRRRVALDDDEDEDNKAGGGEDDEDVEMDDAEGANEGADAVMRESEEAERGEARETEDVDAVDLDAPTPKHWKEESIPTEAKPTGAAGVVRGGAAGGPKRRKVPRSTFDEKGREVVEMVWEDEMGKGGDTEAAAAAPEPMEEEPKAPAPPKSAPTKAAKEAEKPKGPAKKAALAAKGAKKGAQGNIMSFFKKK